MEWGRWGLGLGCWVLCCPVSSLSPQDCCFLGVPPTGHPRVLLFVTERYPLSFGPLRNQFPYRALCRSPVMRTLHRPGFFQGLKPEEAFRGGTVQPPLRRAGTSAQALSGLRHPAAITASTMRKPLDLLHNAHEFVDTCKAPKVTGGHKFHPINGPTCPRRKKWSHGIALVREG